MCGLAAIFAYHEAGAAVERAELLAIREHMAQRGPDGAGLWVEPARRAGLVHRRLAILDLSAAAAQPMQSADGRFVLSFNGEIYNYRELRAELEAAGQRFRTQCDTEVVLALYAAVGDACFARLRGMFAIALWDQRERRLVLARDAFGIKPLYYADDGWCLRAASQVKALLAGGAVSRERDPAGVAGFFLTGSVPEPFTWYRAVRALPAGCFLRVDALGAGEPQRYHSMAQVLAASADQSRVGRNAEVEIADALRDSVRAHLVSDVDVGLFLSAGIDSGAILGLASEELGRALDCVTVRFRDFDSEHDESARAAQVARLYGARHSIDTVDRDTLRAELPRFLGAMDQPTIDGLNTWFASRAAAERGLKVVLSGVGGDELLGGYPSFTDVPRWRRATQVARWLPGTGTLSRRCAQPLLGARHSPKLAGLFEYGASWPGAWLLRRGLFLPHELGELLGEEEARVGLQRLGWRSSLQAPLDPDPGSDFARVSTLETCHYLRNQLLRDTDWASMAFGLEVRTPLIDVRLFESVAPWMPRLVPGEGKQFLARAPRRALPKVVCSQAKLGFGVPFERWLREERELDGWRALPSLSRAGTPWARRWAWSLMELSECA